MIVTPPPELTDPEHALEVAELLKRALNTWEGRPAWAVKWSDQVEAQLREPKEKAS